MKVRGMGFVFFSAVFFALFCGPGDKKGVSEIQWWHAMAGSRREALEGLVNKFNSSQSVYRVAAIYKGSYTETLNAATAAYRADKAPHMVQVFEVGTLTMMLSGAIYPVEDLMKDMGYSIDWSGFLQPVLSYYRTSQGKLLSMPFNSSTPILYYNRDLFRKAGLDVPPVTWRELGEALSRLRKAGAECGMTTAWQSWVQMENYSAVNNVPFATRENGFGGLDAELSFHKTRVREHIRRLKAWQADGRFRYEGRQGEGARAAFIDGRCAVYMDSSAGYSSLVGTASFDWSATTLPHEEGLRPQNSIIGGATIWVMRGHEETDYQAAAAFLNFLAASENQEWWHQETGYLPITLEAYENGKAKGYYEKNPIQEVGILQLTRGRPNENSHGLRLGNFSQIRDVVNEELENLWSGAKTADEALNDAARRGNELLLQFRKQNSPPD